MVKNFFGFIFATNVKLRKTSFKPMVVLIGLISVTLSHLDKCRHNLMDSKESFGSGTGTNFKVYIKRAYSLETITLSG